MPPLDPRQTGQDSRLRPRWSELGFQDLGDDEAFLVRRYRCWQHGIGGCQASTHPLSHLLRQDRLNCFLLELDGLFQAFGRDAVMCAALLSTPQLTWREELLLAMLSDEPDTVGMHCDICAMRCRAGLTAHRALVRHPRRMPRGPLPRFLPCGMVQPW